MFPFETIGSPASWIGFIAFVLVMLLVDLKLVHRTAHEVSVKEAALWSAVWVSLSALFAGGLWVFAGEESALEFTTGYVLEKTLAVDNLFVFVLIFSAFRVPATQQHRVLEWGVIGALAMRAVFIVAGGALLVRFHWLLLVFGALLVVAGLKMLRSKQHAGEAEEAGVVRVLRRLLPATSEFHGERFTVVHEGRRLATPLLMALVAIELSDVIFAADSIPAVFAVTGDPFIVFTSNLFAVLGLRSMYFLLARVITSLEHLKTGLALVLTLIGTKMLLADVVHLPIVVSLGVIAAIIAGAVVASLVARRRRERSAAVPLAPLAKVSAPGP